MNTSDLPCVSNGELAANWIWLHCEVSLGRPVERGETSTIVPSHPTVLPHCSTTHLHSWGIVVECLCFRATLVVSTPWRIYCLEVRAFAFAASIFSSSGNRQCSRLRQYAVAALILSARLIVHEIVDVWECVPFAALTYLTTTKIEITLFQPL